MKLPAFFSLVLFSVQTLVADELPNIVIMMADDQGYQDAGCYGSPDIDTPNMDRLAAEGMRFTSFLSANSVCSASRAGLLTGCYPPRVGVTGVFFPRHQVGLSPEEVTIADIVKNKGYSTMCVGKWHLGHLPDFLPTRNGFDGYFGVPYSNDMASTRKGANGIKGLDESWKLRRASIGWWDVPLLRDETEVERPVDQTTITKRYTEEAVRFIDEKHDSPFFLYFPHTMPHIPMFVSEDFYIEDPMQAYKATIQEIDWSVGQVLEAMQRNGVADNTLFVYTSDNGPWLGKQHHGGSALPLRDGKFSQHEGGHRVPGLMRWPNRIKAGTVSNVLVSSIDLLPTICRLTGQEVPSDRVIDGIDISGLITGETASLPERNFYYYKGTNLRAVRRGDWKVMLRGGRKKQEQARDELYNLRADLTEKTDFSKSNPVMLSELVAAAEAFDESLKAAARPVGALAESRE